MRPRQRPSLYPTLIALFVYPIHLTWPLYLARNAPVATKTTKKTWLISRWFCASPAESPDFFTDLVAALEGGGRGDAYGPSALRGMEDLTLANREGVVTASYPTIHFGA